MQLLKVFWTFRCMNTLLEEIAAANRRYTDFFGGETKLPVPATGRFSVLTCMDARVDPAKFTDLRESDAHVIRNAGGRATDDAIRSLVISYKLLNSRQWFVIHHTDCEEISCQFWGENSLPARFNKRTRSAPGQTKRCRPTKRVDSLTSSEHKANIVAEVRRICGHPLVPPDVVIHAHIYDVRTETLQEVFEAHWAGKETRR